MDDLTGSVVQKGREAGVPVPAHAFILAALLPQEQAARRNAAAR